MADPVYFSRVKLLDGTYAEVKDAVAREMIAGATHFIGVTTTPLTDNQTISSVTIGGSAHTLENGDLMLYNNKEFIFASSDGKVHELGDISGLKALAYKDSATGNYQPEGTVSKPDIDVTPTTATVKGIDAAGSVTAGSANVPTAVSVTPGSAGTPTAVSVTPGTAGTPTAVAVTAGTANTPTAVTVSAGSANVPTAVDVTPGSANVPTAVTLPVLTTSMAGETLEIGWSAGSVTAGTASVPTAVTVTDGVASVPTGVSVTPGVAGVPTVVSVTDGTAGTPTAVSVTPGTAGTPTAVSVTPGTASVPTVVTLPTTKNTTVVTGVEAELHEAPVFSGSASTITVS